MTIKHMNIRVFGVVQGVWFRAHTREQALAIGLTGFVRNEADGSVYIEAEGKEADLTSFVRWCHEGPSMAQVTRVDVTEGMPGSFHDFRIT